MTAAAPNERAIRVAPLVYWLLSGLAAGLAVLVASPLLPEWWRLGIGCANAVVVLLVAKSQPRTEEDEGAGSSSSSSSSTSSRPAGRAAPARRRRYRRGYLSGWCLGLVALLIGSGCLGLLGSRSVSPSAYASCPVGKVCDEATGVPSSSCLELDNAYIGWTAASAAAAGLASAGSLASPFLADHEDALIGVSITDAVLGVLSGVADGIAGLYASRFVEWCGPLPTP